MSPRTARIGLQSVVLGVMTSVVIAWVCAARAGELMVDELELIPGKTVFVPAADEMKRTFGHNRRVRSLGRAASFAALEAGDDAAAEGGIGAESGNFAFYETRDIWGWPLRAMQTHSWQRAPADDLGDSTPSWWTDGLVTSGELRLDGGTYTGRVLPVRPHWSGLVGNTVIYASAWMAVFMFASAALAGRAAGHCPRCEQRLPERRSTGCPECGWVLESVDAP